MKTFKIYEIAKGRYKAVVTTKMTKIKLDALQMQQSLAVNIPKQNKKKL